MLTDEQIDQMKIGDITYIAEDHPDRGVIITKHTVTEIEPRQRITITDENGYEFEAHNVFYANGCATSLKALKELERGCLDNIKFKKEALVYRKERLAAIRAEIRKLDHEEGLYR